MSTMINMWRWIGVLVALVTVVGQSPTVLAETVVRTGGDISILEDQRVEGNFYTLGNSVSIAGPVNGDVVAGAVGTLQIHAPVAHDVLLLGSIVTLHATVTEDVRIVGGEVTITEDVGGSVFVVGGTVKILSSASIAKDLLVVAGEVIIEGDVQGDVLGVAEAVRIDGLVGGNIDMRVTRLVLGERAEVVGTTQYTSPSDLVRAPGAVASGTIARTDPVVDVGGATPRTMALVFLASLFSSLLLYVVFRKPLLYIVTYTLDRAPYAAAAGLASFMVVPVVIAILLASMIGFLIGLVSAVLFVLGFLLAIPLMSIMLGSIGARVLLKRDEINLLSIVSGAIALQCLFFIPYLGGVMIVSLLLVTVGGLLMAMVHALRD